MNRLLASGLTAVSLAMAGWPGSAGAALAEPQLDPLPHQVAPDARPYPDYFTEALKLTAFQPGERFSSLKLAPGVDPDLLVLPVQMQAFGWHPAIAALLGARLDRELAARGLNANRQTDLFDVDGPYARRFSDAQVEAFAAAWPKAQVLALHIGRDAAGHDFLSLSLRRGAAWTRVHRKVDEEKDPLAVFESLAGLLPGMLAELGLDGDRVPHPEPESHCPAQAWELKDLPAKGQAAARACHAAVLGTLLPEFDWPSDAAPGSRTPAKLAWLAQAYVGADALTAGAAAALKQLIWLQLELGLPETDRTPAVESEDPVLRPLARLLWARERSEMLPTNSRQEGERAYVEAQAEPLPPLARAAFRERAQVDESFRHVDLCALERELPSFRLPRGCEPGPTRRTSAAQRAARALIEEWRIAAVHRAIRIEGFNRGDPVARQAIVDALSPQVASHPFIRQQRFATERFDGGLGPYAPMVQRVQAAATEAAQALADLQRWTSPLLQSSVSSGRWATNRKLLSERGIAEIVNDDLRLNKVLLHDGFAVRREPLSRLTSVTGWNYLRAGRLGRAGEKTWTQASSASAPRPVAPEPVVDPSTLFPLEHFTDTKQMLEMWEQISEGTHRDMERRVDWVVHRLRAGTATVGQASEIIDGYLADQRPGNEISLARDWSLPAHMFFFAAEIDAARVNYARAARVPVGSDANLQSRIRLRLIDGDLTGALVESKARLRRYETDHARRDIAGLAFLLGHADEAWEALAPRLPQSDQIELWVGAMVGQRMEGRTARQVRDWAVAADYGHAIAGWSDILPAYLHRYMFEDRIPTPDDMALSDELNRSSFMLRGLAQAELELRRLTLSSPARVDARALQEAQKAVSRVAEPVRRSLAPLYAWVAWQASEGKDPTLDPLRGTGELGNFDAVLAKAMVLGLDGDLPQAMRYLRSARFVLLDQRNPDMAPFRSRPYALAFTLYLLHAQTGQSAYREEALRLARGYQRVFPFLAWPYALDALLSPDGPARRAAVCRAHHLDRQSLFLQRSGQRPGSAKACSSLLWK